MYGYIKLDGLSQIMSLLKHNDDPFENNWETAHKRTNIQPYFSCTHDRHMQSMKEFMKQN